MQGLRERDTNIVKSHSKKNEKDKSLSVPSHGVSRSRNAPKSETVFEDTPMQSKNGGLDDEEMLFLARRFLAEELKTRTAAPTAYIEREPTTTSTSAVSSEPPSTHFSASVIPQLSPRAENYVNLPRRPSVQLAAPRPLIAVRSRHTRMFHVQRLGVGLLVLKFGWTWVSCGGLMMADSVFCTSDICVFIMRRLNQHFRQIGTRLYSASLQSIRLFTDSDADDDLLDLN